MNTRPIYKLDNLYKPRPNIPVHIAYRQQEITDLAGVAVLILLALAVVILAFC